MPKMKWVQLNDKESVLVPATVLEKAGQLGLTPQQAAKTYTRSQAKLLTLALEGGEQHQQALYQRDVRNAIRRAKVAVATADARANVAVANRLATANAVLGLSESQLATIREAKSALAAPKTETDETATAGNATVATETATANETAAAAD